MNVSGIAVGNNIVITNAYNDNNGLLKLSKYGNMDTVAYDYDTLDRITQKTYNDKETGTSVTYAWKYNASNRIAQVSDSSEGRTYNYTYDLSGRLIEMNRDDGAYIRTSYNTKNLTTGLKYSFGGLTESTSYTYQESMDNAPENTYFTDSSASAIAYDSLGRKSMDGLYSGYSFFLKTTYSYLDNASDSSKTSGLVSKIDYDLSSIKDLEYAYDSRGNIVRVIKGDVEYDEYTYDALNRLVRVDSESEGLTYTYTYDASGNITTKTTYACNYVGESISDKEPIATINYTYGDSNWGDKLTAYNGKDCTLCETCKRSAD